MYTALVKDDIPWGKILKLYIYIYIHTHILLRLSCRMMNFTRKYIENVCTALVKDDIPWGKILKWYIYIIFKNGFTFYNSIVTTSEIVVIQILIFPIKKTK